MDPRSIRPFLFSARSATGDAAEHLPESEERAARRQTEEKRAHGERQQPVVARGGDPVIGLEEGVLRVTLVRRQDLRELGVAREVPARDRGGAGPEHEQERPEGAQPAAHEARSAAEARAGSTARRTATRCRRRGSYPTHLLRGTSSAPTRTNPCRSKNCCACSSTVQANTKSSPSVSASCTMRATSRSPSPSPLKRLMV